MEDNHNVKENSFDRILDDLEEQCKGLAEPILNRIGMRIIRKMKKQMATIVIDDDLEDHGMSFFDQLSIYFQSRTYEEIMFGFDDYIDDLIDGAIEDLTEIERLILEHRDLYALSKGEMENRIFVDIKNEVSSIIDEHYYTTRILRFVDRYDLNI